MADDNNHDSEIHPSDSVDAVLGPYALEGGSKPPPSISASGILPLGAATADERGDRPSGTESAGRIESGNSEQSNRRASSPAAMPSSRCSYS